MAEFSKLSLYSIGIVVVDKLPSSKIIEVTPIEDAPMMNGELTDNKVPYKAKGSDDGGAAYEVEMETTASIKATWLPMHSMNRTTAPDVRRGERIVLYRYGDTDEYFWATLWDDLHLRKLETVIYAWSGTKEEDVPVNADNYYFLELSTHKGLVHFHTSKANGEFCVYDIQINPKEGTIHIQDDVGNLLSFDSKQRQIEAKNADGSHLDINKKNISLSCSDTITLEAGKQIVEKTKTHTLTADTFNGQAPNGDFVIKNISHVNHLHKDNGDHGGKTGKPE